MGVRQPTRFAVLHVSMSLCLCFWCPLAARSLARLQFFSLRLFLLVHDLCGREIHCQDFCRLEHVDEKLPQINVLWIASMTLLPFHFVILFVPATATGHLLYLGLWACVLLLVGVASHWLSSATQRLSALRLGVQERKGWQQRDLALTLALFQVGLVTAGASLLARVEHLDILTDDYKQAFRPGHVRVAAVLFVVGVLIYWLCLALRINFRILQMWLGPRSAVLFDGAVPRVRVEIFSDGVYAAAATGLMIEVLSGLLRADEGAEAGGGQHGGSVWPSLVNYIYCFHVVAVLHRSHQNIVAKISVFNERLLAINSLVCLSVAFIPTLSTILDPSWGHHPASLTTGAAFLLVASLLLLFLLMAALQAAPLAEAPDGINESAETLLSEMLGRPIACGMGIIPGNILASPADSPRSSQEIEKKDDVEDRLMPRRAPRLFQEPSCLAQGRGIDSNLLRRLQAIRDEYEIGSASILPVMAFFLTLLTASLQFARETSPYTPAAFLLTFFVYTAEHRILRPRAARKIRKIQRQLQQHQQEQHGYPPFLPAKVSPSSKLETVREESLVSSVGESEEGAERLLGVMEGGEYKEEGDRHESRAVSGDPNRDKYVHFRDSAHI